LGAADPVRIRRSEIGERLAQQDILQAQGVGILAKGEIPEKGQSGTPVPTIRLTGDSFSRPYLTPLTFYAILKLTITKGENAYVDCIHKSANLPMVAIRRCCYHRIGLGWNTEQAFEHEVFHQKRTP
jgi:hypothetical protein